AGYAYVRRSAWTRHGQAVPLGVAGAAQLRRESVRMRIALRRVEPEEAVAVHAGWVVRDERVLPLPSLPVARVVRIEIDQAPVPVGRGALPRRPEAVHRPAVVRDPPEDLVEPSAIDPVGPRLDPGEGARPVREMEHPRSLPGEPRD